MSYLYFYDDSERVWQSDVAPNEQQTQAVIDDELKVYRIDRSDPQARMEVLEPIQFDDKDSWGEISFQR